jgi:regulator of cell morphogenesis and NO signaling
LHLQITIHMSNDNLITTSLGDIVAHDFRAATIFKKAGIDFCCGGKQSLSQACDDKAVDVIALVDELQKLDDSYQNPSQNFKDWAPAFLCDYIENIHHTYVSSTLPELVFYTQKIATVHGSHHPELIEVASLFAEVNKELIQHMQKEEEIVFPGIRSFYSSGSAQAKENLIQELPALMHEHESAGGAMDKINLITRNYKVPEDGCNTYHVAFKMLEQFEDDLHIHVHLENNILLKNLLEAFKK